MSDPFSQGDLHNLQTEFTSSIENGSPLYLLVDIRQFNALNALALIGGTNGMPLPHLSAEQANHSRLAIVGGNAMVNLLLKMVDGDDSDQIRPFVEEEEGIAWLTESARNHQSDDG